MSRILDPSRDPNKVQEDLMVIYTSWYSGVGDLTAHLTVQLSSIILESCKSKGSFSMTDDQMHELVKMIITVKLTKDPSAIAKLFLRVSPDRKQKALTLLYS